MESIALPQKISFEESQDKNQGSVIIEPLYIGYGMTLGNSLRRVLLSSLQGAAVTGVKIKGADHEFMPLENIREDVLEIILNLKKLRVKSHSDEVVKLELKAEGKKEVKAKNIKKNSDIEIINPDLTIANITNPKGSLEMEIFVDTGRGYKVVDTSKKSEKEIGYLEIDSIFSPVLSVSINVENVRVGKMTNWDKLILDINTDGTLSPKEAFNKAVKILVEQFNSLSEQSEEKKEEKKKKKTVTKKTTKATKDKEAKKEKK